MLKLKKNYIYQTVYPDIFWKICSIPHDALPGDHSKQFYIIMEIDRSRKDGRDFACHLTTKSADELREALGGRKREKIEFM